MKRIFLVACAAIALITTEVKAQSLKLGHINSQELLALMPEVKKAEADLKAYTKSFEDQLETMGKDYQKKMAEYQAQEKTMTDAVKEVRQKEITDLGARIESTQKSAEEKVGTKQAELFKPVLDKAEKAIKDVAKEKGIDYVFDLAKGAVIVSRDSDNMLPAVKAKLGIQ